MPRTEKTDAPELLKEWALSPATTLGSSVRAKGILLEVRARLPLAIRKSLDIDGSILRLVMPETSKTVFRSVSAVVTEALADIESLPVIPREIQDILTITTTERHRWLKDGRLQSAGIRTVRLRGRAKQITFHVFDPRFVEDLLNRSVVDEWREDDVIAAAEKRRQASWKRKLTRSLKTEKTPTNSANGGDDARSPLSGWEEFGRDGLLR
ncbi:MULTISPECIES: hypothetical protein [unclassified Rhizobium]|uniref:hypothetical protein n=1 Tax=unclassified Rhizobium TaxID=2613769 RepID=UPI001AD993DE|nr:MULTISPECIES: hypothetical protein [unclassified Rhizobium]MBO9097665.1 hypothetical protein [Rhizobium sp. L58/93]MBO9133553.1 hypothetical protein [Rhizobium sp. B209b/85]MBO9167814.1 hypothetical protein [Rhizobium sp. L245/93]MBO9183859.1 hypothetical protein [Rhizobium sp. E27B/91]QXZ84106.1 hypothetical protein J5287_00585 [Rhizobium sp. K1/93]